MYGNHPNGTWNSNMGYGLLNAHKAVLSAAYYQIYGEKRLPLCDNISYTVINQYNQFETDVAFEWTCSDNIRIISGKLTSSVVVKGVGFGEGWLSCQVIHMGDTISSCKNVYIVENNEAYYIDSTLISTLSFPSTFTIGGTVDIGAGTTITWTDKTVHIAKDARLIVRPGGKLVVDGGTLTSACPGEMWQGIEVVGDRTKRQLAQWQGTVELKNGAVIENAHCGIRTGIQGDAAYATAGGIILADSAFFKNNRRAVAFMSYTNHSLTGVITDNVSHFTNCEFSGFSTAIEANTTGDQHVVWVNRANFRDNETGIKINGNHFATVIRNDFDLQASSTNMYNAGLCLNNCGGYQVEGNRFHRASGHYNYSSMGIGVQNSGVTDNSIYRNVFDNLSYGIYVTGTNGNATGGLQMLCGDFSGNGTDIYLATSHTIVSSLQGSLQLSAGNTFSKAKNYNIQNMSDQSLVYFYTGTPSSSNPYYPSLRTSNVLPYLSNTANPCASTLCDGGGTPRSLAQFQSDADADTYYTAVRTLMSDTVLDLNELEQWHTAAQSANLANYANIGDPYSLAETRFMEGYAETFAGNAEDAEMANYAEFHALKLLLRGDNNDNSDNQDNIGNDNSPNSLNSPTINWYSLTESQIAQLQTIAERNTGRASVMAKGVLCFFHGICYEDEWDDAGAHAGTPQQGDDTTGTRAKRTAMDTDNDATLSVYPNPTDDILFVELCGGAGIANMALYDLQGRVVGTRFIASATGASATVNRRDIPAGVYVLRVTDTDGKEYHKKIVRK